MDDETLYELVADAVRAGIRAELGGDDMPIAKRMAGGRVIFEDEQGRTFKEVPALHIFKKITAVREKLRVLEQKLNNHDALSDDDKADLQGYISRAYGSLTTFNVLFADESDKFKGTGG